jgi:hypothetical protein
MAATATVIFIRFGKGFFPISFVLPGSAGDRLLGVIVRVIDRQFKQGGRPALYDFRMRLQAVMRCLPPVTGSLRQGDHRLGNRTSNEKRRARCCSRRAVRRIIFYRLLRR